MIYSKESKTNMKILDRDVALKSLVGSHNYNLAHKDSDKDYKVFVIPTFEELYNGRFFSKDIITPTEDNSIHDIRKLPELFFKANLNYLEILASKELYITEWHEELFEIYKLRNEIYKMNLPKLYNACFGMFKQKMSLLGKGTEGTQHLVDLYGYDTKQATHAFRNLKFLVDFHSTEFEDFENTIKFDGEDLKLMLSIRNGEFTKHDFEDMANDFAFYKVSPLVADYHAEEPNFELKEQLDQLIMNLVKRKVVL